MIQYIGVQSPAKNQQVTCVMFHTAAHTRLDLTCDDEPIFQLSGNVENV